MPQIKLKSLEEVLLRFKELVHRHRRRFLRRNLRPCPLNCNYADMVGHTVVGCGQCGSRNPEFCKKVEQFEPLYSKGELSDQFKKAIRDPQILLRDYRDVAVFLWLLGNFDTQEKVPEHIIKEMETHEVVKP